MIYDFIDEGRITIHNLRINIHNSGIVIRKYNRKSGFGLRNF